MKCNGLNRCQQCTHHGLQCSYSNKRQNPRSSRNRGRILSEFKAPAGQSSSRTLLPNTNPPSDGLDPLQELRYLLTIDLNALTGIYTSNLYPSHPIITPSEFAQCLQTASIDRSAAAFIFAAAAACLHCAPSTTPGARLEPLLAKSVEHLGPLTLYSSVSVRAMMTSIFLANTYVAVGDSRTAFLYLRQATSMIETYRLPSKNGPEVKDPRLVRLYWFLYVHERYQCIAEYRATLLKPLSPSFATSTADPHGEHKGFMRVVALFCLLDDVFVSHWLGDPTSEPITAAWIAAKCEDFYADERAASPLVEDDELDAAQRVDLLVTRHWLLVLAWRIAMSHKLLRETPPHDCLSMHFPLHVSQRLQEHLQNVPSAAVETHGVGIVQKVFELADTVADVFTHVPESVLSGSTEHLRELWRMLRCYPRLDATRKGILYSKFRRVIDSETPTTLTTRITRSGADTLSPSFSNASY